MSPASRFLCCKSGPTIPSTALVVFLDLFPPPPPPSRPRHIRRCSSLLSPLTENTNQQHQQQQQLTEDICLHSKMTVAALLTVLGGELHSPTVYARSVSENN
ncbi:hypothetical protein E2C01_058451 [Portunus trituberculatus]|uniref:Uncharacterized protein n=1 Tax=Portunus trituberculatus TaxID=210409 RepID=A0A5B7H5E8_PORTR|nr:hypothetical protein [Portunus trituberculatus]